ncbi:MAG: ABC transporter permease [Bacteroidales bacterium]|nr:ABC transporter permease [Bacteroidales bacterium]MDY0085644.1 ABC transporter permease [Bacteroidales bacterium]
MNTTFFFAKRYLLARKSHNLINIITWISVLGVGVGAFALIVVLSVFNGFEKVISTMISQLSADLVIEPASGKTIQLDTFPMEQILALDATRGVVKIVEEDALFRYGNRQHVGVLRGVSEGYEALTAMDSITIQGSLILEYSGQHYAMLGSGVAWYLDINPRNPAALLQVLVPSRGNPSVMQFEQAFNQDAISISGIYSSQQEMDATHVIVPYDWAAKLMEYEGMATSIDVFAKSKTSIKEFKQKIKQISGSDFLVKDQFEQQETLYQIMRSEKWAIYIILTFILIMATFNVIGSLSMLIVDKRKDINILKYLGADQIFLRRLFLAEGLMISVLGGIIGLLAGIILVLAQERFGLLKLGGELGAFVIDVYPVQLVWQDVMMVFLTVMVVGGLSAVFTVYKALKRIKTLRLME